MFIHYSPEGGRHTIAIKGTRDEMLTIRKALEVSPLKKHLDVPEMRTINELLTVLPKDEP